MVAPVGKTIYKKGRDAPVLFDFDRKLFWDRFLKAMFYAAVAAMRDFSVLHRTKASL